MCKATDRVCDFRTRLRYALQLRGLKATDLSDKTGIPKGAISYYLSGKSQPRANRLHIISTTLDVSEAWLMGYDVSIEKESNASILTQAENDHELLNLLTILAKVPREKYKEIKQMITSMSQGGNNNDK